MSSEGSREIQAARQRLAAAKKMAITADAMAVLAQKNKEDAQSEVEAAEAFLKEAEKRWEVVEIDFDGDEKENAGRPKKRRRKTPAAQRVAAATAAGAAAAPLVRNDNNSAATLTSSVCETITVAGSGTAEVNGTYKRRQHLNCRVEFVKGGEWKVKRGEFTVHSDSGYWHIDFFPSSIGAKKTFFRTMSRVEETELPPGRGWMAVGQGEGPPPRITWQ